MMAVDKHFDGKEVGVVESLLPCTLGGKGFKVVAMKEEEIYVMKIMTRYGSCREVEHGATTICD